MFLLLPISVVISFSILDNSSVNFLISSSGEFIFVFNFSSNIFLRSFNLCISSAIYLSTARLRASCIFLSSIGLIFEASGAEIRYSNADKDTVFAVDSFEISIGCCCITSSSLITNECIKDRHVKFTVS